MATVNAVNAYTFEKEIRSNKLVIRKNGYTSDEYFVWKFEGADLKLFKNAKKHNVIRSNYFEIDGCVFYLECTPNGWGTSTDCVVWCALSKLPDNIERVKVTYKYVCDEVGFVGKTEQTLTTKKIGLTKGGKTKQTPTSTSAGNKAKLKDFEHVESFSFRCYIKLHEFYDKNGKTVQIVKQQNNESKTDDNTLQELQVLNLSLQNALNNATKQLQEEKQSNQAQRSEFQGTIDDLLNEQTKLNNKNEQVSLEINKWTNQTSMLRQENANLKQENANLNEECKDYQLQLADIKTKYDKLYRKHNIDIRNYKNWDHDTIADWIISLDDGAYEMYENSLRSKMKEESMSGAFLHELDKSDLDRFGIKSFGHKSSIIKHIQKLISQQNKNNEGTDVTQYI